MAICTWKLATTKNSQHGTFLMYSLFNTPDSDHQPVMRVAWSPVWSFHSQWWFGLPCHLLVLVHCVFWSPVNAAIYQDVLEHFILPSADKLYGDADFIFQQDLAPAHTAKGTKSWFSDHGVTVLDWPANSPDLNPIENLDERHKTQQCRWAEGRC